MNSLSVAQASLNQLRGPEGASDVNSRAVFAGANVRSSSGCQFQIFHDPVNVVHKRRTQDFRSSKAVKRIEMNILNAVHPLHVFSFKLTKTPFEAL